MKKLKAVIQEVFSTRPFHYGMALSGGGAKGFAHLGTLMALEKFGMKPDILSGVSAGSIIATLTAAGLSPRDIIECFSPYAGFKDFTAITVPRNGLFKIDRFARIFESWLPVKYLEELKIPTVVCATDIERGRSVGWWKGEITPRVMASCSMPIIFTPREIDGRTYVDGGVLRNLPAWPLREKCHTLIGSNCSPLGSDFKMRNTLVSIAWRSYNLMSKSNTLRDSLLCDLVIRHTTISGIHTFDMSNLRKTVLFGYDISCKTIENYLLNQLSV